MLPAEMSKCTANAPATQASNCGKVFANANKKNSFLSRISDKMFWTGFMLYSCFFFFEGLIGALDMWRYFLGCFGDTQGAEINET
jgi:hypothetical protein